MGFLYPNTLFQKKDSKHFLKKPEISGAVHSPVHPYGFRFFMIHFHIIRFLQSFFAQYFFTLRKYTKFRRSFMGGFSEAQAHSFFRIFWSYERVVLTLGRRLLWVEDVLHSLNYPSTR